MKRGGSIQDNKDTGFKQRIFFVFVGWGGGGGGGVYGRCMCHVLHLGVSFSSSQAS